MKETVFLEIIVSGTGLRMDPTKMEFNDNNNTASAISLSPFYLNKGFHPRMSFDRDFISYEITRERLQATKAEDISIRIKKLLEYKKSRLKINREIIKN